MNQARLCLLIGLAGALCGCTAEPKKTEPAPVASPAAGAAEPITTPNGVKLPPNSIAAQDFRDGKK